MKKVVFACVHNAGRSQMAAALFNHFADKQKAVAISAGTEPAKHVHPVVVEVMKEMGIDLSNAVPVFLNTDLAQGAHLLITMGCGEKCPYVPGLRREDWPLEDPKGKPMDQVIAIRNEIARLVKDLLNREGWSGRA